MDKFILGIIILYIFINFSLVCLLYETIQELKKLLKEFINKMNK